MSESIILPRKPELHYPFLSDKIYPVTNPFLSSEIVYLETWCEVAPNVIERGNLHWGLDYGAPYSELVLAPFSGSVYWSGAYPQGDRRCGRGLYVGIDNEDGHHFWVACHLSEALVQPGDTVSAGDQIGRVGQSGYAFGPHLHEALGCLVDGRVIWRNHAG